MTKISVTQLKPGHRFDAGYPDGVVTVRAVGMAYEYLLPDLEIGVDVGHAVMFLGIDEEVELI